MKEKIKKLSIALLAFAMIICSAFPASAAVTKQNYNSSVAFDGRNALNAYGQLAKATITKNSKTMEGYNYTIRSTNNVWRCVQTNTFFPKNCTTIKAAHSVKDYITGANVYNNSDIQHNEDIAYAVIHSWRYSKKISNFGCVEAIYNGVAYTEYPTTIGW